jgi:hypothetical protein
MKMNEEEYILDLIKKSPKRKIIIFDEAEGADLDHVDWPIPKGRVRILWNC